MNGEAAPVEAGSAARLLDAVAGGEPVAALSLGQEFGGGRLLLSDIRLTFWLINHARYRALARMFGVSPDQANLLTLVIIMAIADGAQVTAKRLLRGPPLPSSGDGLLAGASWGELLSRVAGPPASGTPYAGALLTIAILGGTSGPAASDLARGIRTSSHRATMGFHHRYGYIVDPGHWRERRARRRFGSGANGGLAQAHAE